MRSLRHFLLLALAAVAIPQGIAQASLADYDFLSTSGSRLEPTNWEYNLWQSYSGGRWGMRYLTTTVDLPFNFMFGGSSYSQVSISSFGLIALGGWVPADPNNGLTNYGMPIIAPFWDDLYMSGGASNFGCRSAASISVGESGSYPNRVFTIDFKDMSPMSYGPVWNSWQVRLYECSDQIEFWYGSMSMTYDNCSRNWGGGNSNSSASIGIANAWDDYMSISPGTSTGTMSRTTANDNSDMASNEIPQNTIYRFSPSPYTITGNTSEGGVSPMVNGATLLQSISTLRGSTASLQPMTLDPAGSNPSCETVTVTATITGTNASEYSISPNFTSLDVGSSYTPTITFTPTGSGTRSALLTLRTSTGLVRTHALAASGANRISWISNPADGGTTNIANGDTLMRNINVVRPNTRDLSPISIRNFNTDPASTPADLTVVIDSAGQVSQQFELLTPSVVSLGYGQTHVPVIRFRTLGVGVQTARLTISVDGETRVYTLMATSSAPMILLTANGLPINAGEPLFHNGLSCVGEQANVLPIVISNPGTMDLTISGVDFYLTDTTIRQGTPPFPLIRDSRGQLVRSYDYVLGLTPNGAPLDYNTTLPLPIIVPALGTRTIYATFVGQEPGKRFGRVFIRTNAQNVFGTDTTLNGVPNSIEGLQTFDLVGRAVGSQLASNASGLKMKTVVFPHTRAGDTSFMSFTIANAGACDLRINGNKLRIASGDVNEFKLMTSLGNASYDQSTGDYILAPGMTDTLNVRFIPSRGGTRQATLKIQTNDSTIRRPGLTERGAFYLDLHGRGLAGLDARDLVLNPVVIGSSVAGIAQLENSQTVIVGVSSIAFLGDDAAEFSEDAANPWSPRPFNVLPGQKLNLGVRLTPVGSAGPRRTTMVIVTTTGDSIRLSIRGEAGVQSLIVSPTSLFENVTIPSGQTKRQTVMIANNGTLPVRINTIDITGPDAAMYFAGVMPRRDLEGGATEYLEITYAPTQPGQTSAELVITASNGQTYTVVLGGTALRIRRDPIDPPSTGAPTYNVRSERDAADKDRPSLR